VKVFLRFIPAAIIMGIIFYLSNQPGNFVQLPQIFGLDKLLHFVAYATLAATLFYGLHPYTHISHRALAIIIVVLFCVLFGISDEYHQSFVPGRTVSGWDVAADACGALFAAAVWYRRDAAGKRAE
jgi:VanZ family protein